MERGQRSLLSLSKHDHWLLSSIAQTLQNELCAMLVHISLMGGILWGRSEDL